MPSREERERRIYRRITHAEQIGARYDEIFSRPNPDGTTEALIAVHRELTGSAVMNMEIPDIPELDDAERALDLSDHIHDYLSYFYPQLEPE